MKVIACGGAVLLLLPVLQALAPKVFFFLPLGESTIAEIGIVLGLSVAVQTVSMAFGAKKIEENKSNHNT
jgi:hypothetical protein